MRSRYTAILLILIVFGVGFVLGNTRILHKIHKKNHQAVKGSENIPSVDAEITKVTASPDFSQIALKLEDKSNSQSIAVFDLSKKRIIARENIGDNYSKFCWSPDSKWLATSTDKGLVLIDKSGQIHFIRKDSSRPVWRPANPNKLVYTMNPESDVNAIREYDLSTKADRIIWQLPHNRCLGCFTVNGRVYAALLYEVKRYIWKRIDVVDIDSKRKIVSIPGYGWNNDWGIFDMSPDGKTFAINAFASGSSDFIIGRTSDAATTLKHLNRAVLYESYPQSENSVVWALSSSPRNSDIAGINKDPDYALVNSDSFPPRMLNLVDGSVNFEVDYLANISYISWWKDNIGLNIGQQFLAVNSDGLWITTEPRLLGNSITDSEWLKDNYLILRHNKYQPN